MNTTTSYILNNNNNDRNSSVLLSANLTTSPTTTIGRNRNQIWLVISYIPLIIIFIGVVGNISSLFIYRTSKEMKKMSSMMYLSFLAVSDTLSLFQWNLDHYLRPNFGFRSAHLSVFMCKIVSFTQFTTMQISAFLLSIICIDRYVTIASTPGSIYSKLPFSTNKSACAWSVGIICLICLINSHLLIFNGYRKPPNMYVEMIIINNSAANYNANATNYNNNNNNITYKYTYNYTEPFYCYSYTATFDIVPLWDQCNMVLYNFLPFVIMSIFNSLLIKKTLSSSVLSKKKPSSEKSTTTTSMSRADRKKQRLTISLVVITFLFLIMTLPSTIWFGFVKQALPNTDTTIIVGQLLDNIAFLQHSSLLITSYLTNYKFREALDQIICPGRLRRSSSNQPSSSHVK
jgi:hypothetical protein